MGRPLNKKYFGNTNDIFPAASGDNIGGEGIASVTITSAGDYNGILPTVTFGTPEEPHGVTATGTVNGKLTNNTVVAAGGSDYDIGDVLSLSGGAGPTRATATVTRVVTRDDNGIVLVNGGNANDVGDEYWLESAGWSTPLKVRVTASTAGVATAITVVQNGIWAGPGAAPTGNQNGTFHMGPGSIDGNGAGLVFSIASSAYAVSTISVTEQGVYTAVPTNPVATVVAPAGGTGATLTAHWGVRSVTITQEGSGYISAADAAPTFVGTAVVAATGTSVLTNQYQNALVGINLATGKVVDIVKQESSNGYWVDTGTDVILLNLAPSTDAHGLYIEATDSNSNTYWVRKIEGRLVTLGTEGGTGTQWNDYGRAEWNFNSAVAGVSVVVANAA